MHGAQSAYTKFHHVLNTQMQSPLIAIKQTAVMTLGSHSIDVCLIKLHYKKYEAVNGPQVLGIDYYLFVFV